MANEVTADPELVQAAYKQMLADSQAQCAVLQAVATQFQNQIASLSSELELVKAENARLMADTGRQDGVPQGENYVPESTGA